MKGIMIYEAPLWGDEENVVYSQEVTNASYTLKQCCSEGGITCYLEGTATKDPVTKAKCSKDDTYDFKTGALISLMKMCGVEKVVRAYAEIFDDTAYGDALIERDKLKEENKRLKAEKDLSWKNYQRKIQKKQDRINELEAQITASEDDKQKNIEYYEKEIKRLNNVSIASLKEKIEKLKTDCEKLQHGYNDTDMIFCGGRQNGKQYTLLVDLFKKIDQKKVDEAYKEAYNTTLPVWQEVFLRQMGEIHKESKEKTVWLTSQSFTRDYLDSLLEAGKYVVPTKREEMWGKILESSKCPPVEIKVAKQDITTFLRELQDKIPEVMWNGSDRPPTENIVPYWFKHDYIYFALIRNIDKGKLKLCYSEEHHSWIKTTTDYLPPMRWDLFKKGRLVVKVNSDNYKEFYEKCESVIGRKPRYMRTDESFTVYYKNGTFHERPYDEKIPYKYKVVNWEDVR